LSILMIQGTVFLSRTFPISLSTTGTNYQDLGPTELMRLLDISFRAPEENLAFDEVLLCGAERDRTGETLRFWESPVPFVVLGVAQRLRLEVRESACARDGVPILRRCSAGGCIVQGPGCLNYTLVLAHANRPEVGTIRGSYCYILGHIAEAFRKRGLSVRHNGVSDLSLGGKKVSGNAQKRRKRFFLHHGTLLYKFDPELMEKYQRQPQPDARPRYRGDRTHRGFVRNLPMNADELRAVLCEAFEVHTSQNRPGRRELETLKTLACEKYASVDWTRRR